MKITTGKTPLTLTTAAAILSLSLVVNLPGLAVSPMLETIKHIFPSSTELEAQLLTTLPNVLIIPFVLLSGKISTSRHKIAIVVAGLVIFALSVVAYMFATSMTALIIISSLLGAGAGIIVPFSTGLIADTFSGTYKMRAMGYQSGIANLTLVVATFLVGWLTGDNWHLPFLVYAVCIIPLLLAPFLKRIPNSDSNFSSNPDKDAFETTVAETQTPAQATTEMAHPEPISPPPAIFNKSGFSVQRTVGVFGMYFAITFLTIVITYYSPFLIDHHHWDASLTGTVTSLYFLFIFLPGFFLPQILRVFRDNSTIVCTAFIIAGLLLFSFFPFKWAFCVGAVLCGFGYGVIQPLMYDKATRIVNHPRKATLALAIILSANYIAIVIAPFIIDAVGSLLHMSRSGIFPFVFNLILSAVLLIIVIIFRHRFSLAIPSTYYRTAASTQK